MLIQQHLAPQLGDEGLRRGLSLMWQRFAHGAVPYTPALGDDAMAWARQLHAALLPTEGGWRFRTLAAIAGWRLARRARRWAGRP